MELTDWIAALSSVASLVVAILATAIAWTVHKREATRLKEADLAAERSQADLVTAWENAYRVSDVNEVPPGALTDAQILDYGDSVYATQVVRTLVNRSSQPVYDVVINSDHTTEVHWLDILPPGEQQIGFPRYAINDWTTGNLNDNENLLNISFRDTGGHWWVRQAKGTLIKVATPAEHETAMGPGYAEAEQQERDIKAELARRQAEAGDGTNASGAVGHE